MMQMKDDTLELALEVMTDGIWDWDVTNDLVFYSPQWKQMVGFEASELGNSIEEWHKRIHPRDLESMTVLLDRHLKGESDSFSSEHRVLCKDHRYIWVLDEGKAVSRDEAGKAVRVVGTRKNINDHKNIEFRLRERIKELNCHNTLSELLSRSSLSVDEVISQVVSVIPGSWQFPEMAMASVTIGEKVFKTACFQKSRLFIAQDIKVDEKVIGSVDVGYPDNYMDPSDSVFLPEETLLLFSIAVRIGHFIERKWQEEALKQSEYKFRNLLENINDVIYTTDSLANITYISPSITKILGYLPEEITGKNFLFFVGASSEHLQKRFYELKEKIELQYEYQLLSKTGEARWIRLSSKAVFNQEQFIGVTGTLVDITETKQIELELEKSESLYRSILTASPDTIFIADLNGRVLFTSPVALKMFGFGNGLFPLDTPLFDFVDPKDHDKARDAIEKMFHGIFTGATEYIGIKADGTPFDMEVNGEFIRDHDGIPTSMVFIVRDISDRKIAENKLLKSEETYRKLVESIKDIVFEVNLEGTIKYLSPSIEKLFNYKPADLIGKNFFSFVHPDDQPFLKEVFKNNRFNEYNNIEYRCLSDSGKIVWVQVSAQYSYEEGRISGRTGIMHDITDQKLAEEKLRNSEEKFSKAFLTSPYAISITNAEDGVFYEVNDSFTKYTGYTKEEIYADSSIGLRLWVDIEDRNSVVAELTQGREVLAKEIKFQKKSGDIAICIFSASMIYLNSRPYILSSITDISKAKQAEEQLRKLSRAVEQSPVSIVIANLEGNIEYANPRACETTGYSLDELIGENPRLLKSGETQQREYEVLWEDITSGNEWRGVFHNIRKNGELYWEASTISPITDGNGEITHYLAIKEDITNRRRIEEALLKSEARFRQTAEQSRTVIWEVDPSGLFTYVSPVALSVWGYSPNELIGKLYFYDLHPEEGRNEFKKVSLEFFARKESFHGLVNEVVTRDNRTIVVLTNGVPVVDDKQNLIGYRGADNDITEQKMAEDLLRRNEEALNYAQEVAQMGSWELNLHTNQVRWSKNYFRLLGLEPHENPISEDLFTNMVHPEDLHLLEEKYQKIQKMRQSTSVDLRIIMPDGRIKWVQNNIVPYFEGNELVTLKGINIDITEKKLVEETLKINEAALNQAQEISGMCSWEFGPCYR